MSNVIRLERVGARVVRVAECGGRGAGQGVGIDAGGGKIGAADGAGIGAADGAAIGAACAASAAGGRAAPSSPGFARGDGAAASRPRVSAVPPGAERPIGAGRGALMAQAGFGTQGGAQVGARIGAGVDARVGAPNGAGIGAGVAARIGAGVGAKGAGFVRGGACGRAVARPTGLAEGEVPDAAWVTARLEEAGRTLLALPGSGYTTKLRTSSLDIVRTAMEAFGGEVGRARPPVPSAAHITRMDEALGWIPLIPQDRYVLRRIVGARCLVSPVTERALYSWRKLGGLLGADHKAVQRWHAQGIALLVGLLGG